MNDDGFVLTVIIPVFNEARTVLSLLDRVQEAPYKKQIIVVDDGSSDGTRELLASYRNRPSFEVVFHETNRGKGAAIRTAIPYASGDVTIIQDADLEYDPGDYPILVEIIRRGYADVVYGSRYMSGKNELPVTRFRIGVHALNLVVSALFFTRMTDEATCYKAFRTGLLKSIKLECRRFEFCPEVTAKLLRRKVRIVEVPISYRFRTVAEGKKINWIDFVEAVATLLKWRVLPERATRTTG